MRLQAAMVCRLGAGTLLVLAAAGTLRADRTPRVPTFGIGVELVSLNVVVTDQRGQPVPGLGPSDVDVLEDGVRQPISLFAQEEWPIRLQVLMDASGSMGVALPVAKRAAHRMIATLREGDEAEIAQFTRRLTVLQESTGERSALDQAIDSVQAGGETALYNALYVALKERLRTRDPEELSRSAIVLLSDGEDTASMVDDEQLIDLARRSRVVIYPIGLMRRAAEGFRASAVPAYFLTRLARETGGRAYFPDSLDELESAYAQVAAELRTLYGIGYVPLNPRADGGWRHLAVRAPRGLRVRHRTGYYAPDASSGRRLLRAPAR
jgi:Ca-activated chloride channel family protein